MVAHGYFGEAGGAVCNSADKPLSLASQAMPVAARAIPLPQGEGIYQRFYLLPFAQENGFSQTLNRFLHMYRHTSYVCNQNVTGPSLTSRTCISAPKMPHWTGAYSACISAQKRAKNGSASAGGIAGSKPGRLPFVVFAAG